MRVLVAVVVLALLCHMAVGANIRRSLRFRQEPSDKELNSLEQATKKDGKEGSAAQQPAKGDKGSDAGDSLKALGKDGDIYTLIACAFQAPPSASSASAQAAAPTKKKSGLVDEDAPSLEDVAFLQVEKVTLKDIAKFLKLTDKSTPADLTSACAEKSQKPQKPQAASAEKPQNAQKPKSEKPKADKADTKQAPASATAPTPAPPVFLQEPEAEPKAAPAAVPEKADVEKAGDAAQKPSQKSSSGQKAASASDADKAVEKAAKQFCKFAKEQGAKAAKTCANVKAAADDAIGK